MVKLLDRVRVAGIQTGKFNSLVLRNYNISAASRLFDYVSTSGYNNNLGVKALLMWTVSLTDAELEVAHDSFTQMATWYG